MSKNDGYIDERMLCKRCRPKREREIAAVNEQLVDVRVAMVRSAGSAMPKQGYFRLLEGWREGPEVRAWELTCGNDGCENESAYARIDFGSPVDGQVFFRQFFCSSCFEASEAKLGHAQCHH